MVRRSNGHVSGFTLIELLVVVLIIGILAAIALPQYTKAVNKARVAKAKPVLKSLSDAWDVFFMANPDVTCSSEECLELLDVTPPQDSDFTFYLDEVICGSNGRCGAIISASNDKMQFTIDYFSAGYDGGSDPNYSNTYRCSAASNADENICSDLGATYNASASAWFF